MRNQIREARKNSSGFTLIELLIVIVILGVLAGIVVFAVGAFNNDGVAAACKADLKNVEIAEEAYFAKTGAYPAPLAGATAADSTARIGVLVSTNYLKEPPSSTKYTITVGPNGAVSGNC